MYLLDTDVCIRFLRGDKPLMKKVRSIPRSKIATSIFTTYELELGFRKSVGNLPAKRRAIDKLLELFTITPFGRAEANEAAEIRAELEASGTPIGSIDYLIAATARSNNHILVTGNTKEFSRVKGLKTKSW